MESNLKIELEKVSDDVSIIAFDGELDKAGHSGIRKDLDASVKKFGGKTLVFDFARLKFINSEGIGYLMEIHTHLIKQDKKLIIVGLNAHVKDVFKTIGIQDLIEIHANVDPYKK